MNTIHVENRPASLRAELRAIERSAQETAHSMWEMSIALDRDEVTVGDATALMRRLSGYIEGVAARIAWVEKHMAE